MNFSALSKGKRQERLSNPLYFHKRCSLSSLGNFTIKFVFCLSSLDNFAWKEYNNNELFLVRRLLWDIKQAITFFHKIK